MAFGGSRAHVRFNSLSVGLFRKLNTEYLSRFILGTPTKVELQKEQTCGSSSLSRFLLQEGLSCALSTDCFLTLGTGF